MTITDTSSEPPVDRAAPRGSRAWHHSIGGKLLIAFGLIAALTIGATFLSLMRFNQIESVLHGLVDVSMPALKLSMDVQSRAADVIETASEVGNAQDEIERFNGMSTATERIGNLWQAIEKLRAVVVDEQTMVPIQALIARIDSQVGDLNRTVGDGLSASQAPAKVFQQIGATTAAANKTIASILDRVNPAHAAPAADPVAESARLLGDELHDLRSDFNDAARILNSVRQANSSEALKSHCASNSMRPSAASRQHRQAAAESRTSPRTPSAAPAAARESGDALDRQMPASLRCASSILRIRTSIASITKSPQDGRRATARDGGGHSVRTPRARPPSRNSFRPAPSRRAASGCC